MRAGVLLVLVLLCLALGGAADELDETKIKEAEERWNKLTKEQQTKVVELAKQRAEEKIAKAEADAAKAKAEAAKAAKTKADAEAAKAAQEKAAKEEAARNAKIKTDIKPDPMAEPPKTPDEPPLEHFLMRPESRTPARAALFWSAILTVSFITTRLFIWCCGPRGGGGKPKQE